MSNQTHLTVYKLPDVHNVSNMPNNYPEAQFLCLCLYNYKAGYFKKQWCKLESSLLLFAFLQIPACVFDVFDFSMITDMTLQKKILKLKIHDIP